MYVEYHSNNSGGSWWLDDDDWNNLERAGWKVAWHTLSFQYDKNGNQLLDSDGTPKLGPFETSNSKYNFKKPGGRWLGALAGYAYRAGLRLREAAEEWEKITGKSATDVGCSCCGQPHYFTEYDDNGKFVSSGPDVESRGVWS